VRIIALEESLAVPGLASAAEGLARSDLYRRDVTRDWLRQLPDIEEVRIPTMDAHGIDVQVLSLAAPGIQAIPDPADAVAAAKRANDYLAEVVHRYPTRFLGLAAIALQDARSAVIELRRAVTELGLVGVLVNGHTHGQYLDAPQFRIVWEALEELEVPLYLHPGAPQQDAWQVLQDFAVLKGSTWSWAAEVAGHALRLVYGATFDDFPAARLILGHMGEFLPFQMARLDARYEYLTPPRRLRRPPSAYVRENMLITTSGVCSDAALTGAIMAMGADSVMFAVDYPFENTKTAVDFLASAPLDAEDRAKIAFKNAERLFKLSPS
jgi:2,3-dihydroxybenzoate decarboxylase